MNRRYRKKQQTAYLALVQQKWAQINWHFDWQKWAEQPKQLWSQLPKLHQRALMVLIPVVLILMIIPLPEKTSVDESANERISLNINTNGLSEQRPAEQPSIKSKAWHEYIVQDGDTLAQVFRTNELSMADLNALVKIEGSDKPLSQIKKGQLIRFKLNPKGELDILQLEKSNQSVMFFRLSDGGFGRSK